MTDQMDEMTVGVKADSLLDSLVLFTELYHKPCSAEVLTAGLPVEKGQKVPELFSLNSSKSLFSRAAGQAGLRSSFVKKQLDDISVLQLPMIVFLKDGSSCILEQIAKDRSTVKLVFAIDQKAVEEWKSLSDFDDIYAGVGFLLKKYYSADKEVFNTLQIDQKHWFWDTLKRSKSIYIDVILASILINIFVLATPLFTMNVYDRVIPTNATETLWFFAVGVLLVYLIDFVLKSIRVYFLEIAGKKSDVIMSSIIFEKVMDTKMSSIPGSVGSFASNLKDFESVRSFFTSASLVTLVDLPFAVIFLVVIFYLGGIIVLVPLTIIAVMLFLAYLIKDPLHKRITQMHEVSSKKNGILVESLQNIETVKSLGISSYMQWAWEEATGEIARKGLKARLMASLVPNLSAFFVQLNTVSIIIIGVYLIKDFELTMGGLIAIVILSSRTVAPVGQAVALITNYSEAKTAYHLLDEIVNLPSERDATKSGQVSPRFTGDIEFRNVTFCYPNTDIKVLDSVSFHIKSGEKVAFLGRMGTGKSTIAKLLLKIYEPESGSILIDGIDIEQVDVTELRRHIGYVAQDVSLFRGTIKDNILYGDFSRESELLRVAEMSGVQEFVSRHPLGYQMPIGERGQGLSGGQKQSVGIARALISNAPIYVFDEPSNAMDQQTENNLIAKLKPNLVDKTLLLVTQKMGVISLVDRLIVLHEGKIYLDGPRDQVVRALSEKPNE